MQVSTKGNVTRSNLQSGTLYFVSGSSEPIFHDRKKVIDMSAMISIVVLGMIPILKIVFVNKLFNNYFPCFALFEVDYGNPKTLIQEILMQLLYHALLGNFQQSFNLIRTGLLKRQMSKGILYICRNSKHEEQGNDAVIAIVSSAVHGGAPVFPEIQAATCLEEELDNIVVATSNSQVNWRILVDFLINTLLVLLDFFLEGWQVSLDYQQLKLAHF